MKSILRNKAVGFLGVMAVLVAGTIGYSQNYFNQVQHLLFDVQDPKIRFSGTAQFEDLGGLEILKLAQTASAVNEVTVTNAATGAGASIAATGGDTNIPLVLNGKGTSGVALRSHGIVTTAATLTLTANDCGSTVVGNATSGTQVFTLPAASTTGCRFTFIAGDAGTEIQFKSAAVATCVVTVFAAVGVDADTSIVTDTSCEGGIKNTGATNAIGDSITIISDGTRWLGVGIASGIWAVV